MLCPIPPVNWKEETGPRRFKEPSPAVASPVTVHQVLDSEACPIAPQDWRSLSQGVAPGRIAVPVMRRTITTASTASSEGDKSGGKRRGETATHDSTLNLIVDAIQPAQAQLTKIGAPGASSFATPTYFAASQPVASALMSPRPVTGAPSSSATSSETGAPSGTLRSSSGSSRSSRSSSRSSACAEEVQLEVAVKSPDARAHAMSLAPSSLPASTTASPCGKGVRALARRTSEFGPTRNSSERSDIPQENCGQAELRPMDAASAIGDFSRGSSYTGLVKSSFGGPFLTPLFPSYASSAASAAAPAVSTTSVPLFPLDSDLSVSHSFFNPASARDAAEPAAAVTAARRVSVGGVAQFPCYQSPRDVFAEISTSPTDQAAMATGSCFGRAAAEGTTDSGRRQFSEASSREEAIRAGIEMGMVMGVGVEIGQRCRETMGKGGEEAGADVPAVSCADWSELSHLCGKMDAAGIRIEQIDLTTLGDTVDDIAIH
ncbi:unnamed protein product [Closterium sp. NIES-53]